MSEIVFKSWFREITEEWIFEIQHKGKSYKFKGRTKSEAIEKSLPKLQQILKGENNENIIDCDRHINLLQFIKYWA